MTTPQNKGQEELREKFKALDVDFGYAVGNLGEDCKDDTVETLVHLFNQELEARVKEAEERGASIAASAINREVGIEMTLNGSYYLDRHARGLAPLPQPKEEK